MKHTLNCGELVVSRGGGGGVGAVGKGDEECTYHDEH